MGKPQRRRKRRTHLPEGMPRDGGASGSGGLALPKSFVFRRGKKHARALKALEGDLRSVMRPLTADKLKVKKNNTLKDFVNVAGPLGVSHLLMLSATDRCQYLCVSKSPRGPSVTFKVNKWSSMGDLAKCLEHYRGSALGAYRTPPLLVLSGFSKAGAGGDGAKHLKLCASMLQGMFPTMEVGRMKISECQRVVLIHHCSGGGSDGDGDGVIQFRHYAVSQTVAGVSKNVRSILKRDIPDLGHLQDISQFLTNAIADGSSDDESDGEVIDEGDSDSDEGSDGGVEPTAGAASKKVAKKSVVKLHEIGPRLDLQLVKIEEGLCDGKVLYHAFVKKSKEEVEAMERNKANKDELKRMRKREQDENVERKRKQNEENAAKRKKVSIREDHAGDEDKNDGNSSSSGDESSSFSGEDED